MSKVLVSQDWMLLLYPRIPVPISMLRVPNPTSLTQTVNGRETATLELPILVTKHSDFKRERRLGANELRDMIEETKIRESLSFSKCLDQRGVLTEKS